MKKANWLTMLVAVVCLTLSFAALLQIANAAGTHKTPVAPSDYLAKDNPFDYEDVEERFLKKAKRLYKSKCKKCHGMEGDGKGSATGEIRLKPTAFNVPGYMNNRKVGQLFWIIEKGSPMTEMKAFGPGTDISLSEEEIWKIITFMQSAFTR